jgi:autoinducer 2-degrading protein
VVPLVILVEFLVKPAFVQRFTRLIRANAKASVEREPGCRRFDVLLAPDDPCRFVLYEIYDDAAAFDRHIGTRHFKAFAAATEGQIDERSVRRLGFVWPKEQRRPALKKTGGKTKMETKAKTRGKGKRS